MRFIKYILFLFILFSFVSCYTYRSVGLMQDKNSFLPEYEQTELEVYRIRINDEIIYRLITDDEDLSNLISANISTSANSQFTYRVMHDGMVDLPFLKNIHVEGLTIQEATDLIEKRYRELAAVGSDVTIKLAINKTFTVIGELSSGIYPLYKEKMTIYQALALTGDISQNGDRKHVKIIRETNDGTKVLEFDIRPASLIKSDYYYIYPNDIIYVQRAKSSFFKVANFSGFLGIINSTITLFVTVFMYTTQNSK